jgi:hypothetical protein
LQFIRTAARVKITLFRDSEDPGAEIGIIGISKTKLSSVRVEIFL